MTSKLLLINCLIASSSLLVAQTTVSFKVNSALDDHEERTTGPVPQSGTVGAMYPGSTSLELGYEAINADPVITGLRFTNVTVPKYASIMSAYIQFTVKGTAKNTDPCNLTVQAENSANPVTFSDNAFSLSSRTMANGSIAWNVSGSTWATVGSAGVEQRTSELKSLVTPLVFNSSWVSGNAMAFFIKGIGTREVQSFEGDPLKTAELVITYSVAGGTPTGIEELTKSASASVYPNPFKNTFTVNVNIDAPSDLKISVYDLTGKLVEEKIVKQAPVGTFHYSSICELTAGMYFVKVQSNNEHEVIKIVAQ